MAASSVVPSLLVGNTWTPQYYTSNPLVGNNTGGSAPHVTDNVDYYQQFGSLAEPGTFNGTAGIGQGLLSARPSTCTAGTDPMTNGSAPGSATGHRYQHALCLQSDEHLDGLLHALYLPASAHAVLSRSIGSCSSDRPRRDRSMSHP